MKVYLAGPIRDKTPYDVEWRRQVAQEVNNHFLHRNGPVVTFLDPMAGQYELEKGQWYFNGQVADPDIMVPRDLYQLRQADLVFANLLPMEEGYPAMGSLMELGVALERRQLVIVVAGPRVLDHPFIQRLAYAKFLDLNSAIHFLKCEAGVLP